MRRAAGGFFSAVYNELRGLAARRLRAERAGHTLDATALVHEAYLRLDATFPDRSGGFRAAAAVTLFILVAHARGRKVARRGGGVRAITLDDVGGTRAAHPDFVLDVGGTRDRLVADDPTSADVTMQRPLAGLPVEGVAEALRTSHALACREWAYARFWLATALASAR